MITIENIKRIFSKDQYQLKGLSTDTKPTDVPVNTILLELDTSVFWYFDGSAWNEIPNSNIKPESYVEMISDIQNQTLKPGQIYQITDYVTKINGTYDISDIAGQTAYIHYAKSAEHPFDLLVQAIDESHIDEHAVAIPHEGDTYFSDSDLPVWEIKYTIENNPQEYAWADSENGKGVIYYMKDEYGNECYYDFKNIQFLLYALTSKDGQTYNDFCYDSNNQPNRYGTIYDIFTALTDYMQSGTYESPFMSNNDFAVGANILGVTQFAEVDDTYLQTFNADWYYTFDALSRGEHFDLSVMGNYDSKYCWGNHIGMVTDALTSMQYSGGNRPWGLPCIVFEAYAGYGGQDIFIGNKFGHSDYFLVFGDTVGNNTFGDLIIAGMFGNNFIYNAVGSNSNNIYAESDCRYITFGNTCREVILPKYLENTILDDGVQYLTLENTTQSSICCYHILSGHYDAVSPIALDNNSNTVMYIGFDSSNNLRVWAIADPSAGGIKETTYSALKALAQAGNMEPGVSYRITDYETIINGKYDLTEMVGQTAYVHYAKSAGHQFDLIVTAVDGSHIDEHAKAVQHVGDTYFATSDLSAWDIKYTLDNDPTVYIWAEPTNGKGVIYYMKDEYNNECGYDFKNVQFLAYGLTSADGVTYNGLCRLSDIAPRCGTPFSVFSALQSYVGAGTYVNPFPSVWNVDFTAGALILGTVQFPEVDATYLQSFDADWYYTFDVYAYEDAEHYDYSLNYINSHNRCHNNSIASCYDSLAFTLNSSYGPFGLPANIFQGITSYKPNYARDVFDNKLDSNTYLNIFVDCYTMHLGSFSSACVFIDCLAIDTGCSQAQIAIDYGYQSTIGGFCKNVYAHGFGASRLYPYVENVAIDNQSGSTELYVTVQSGNYNNNTATITQSQSVASVIGINSNNEIKHWVPADLIYPPYNGSVTINP